MTLLSCEGKVKLSTFRAPKLVQVKILQIMSQAGRGRVVGGGGRRAEGGRGVRREEGCMGVSVGVP